MCSSQGLLLLLLQATTGRRRTAKWCNINKDARGAFNGLPVVANIIIANVPRLNWANLLYYHLEYMQDHHRLASSSSLDLKGQMCRSSQRYSTN